MWTDRRIAARLSPMLVSLASELQAEIDRVLQPAPALLRIHASHGFAIKTLHEFLGRAGVVNELRYCGSPEFKRAVDQLPGYQSNNAGSVMTLRQAFGTPVKRTARARGG